MSSARACRAASFTSFDAGKSGNPWAIFTASYCSASRVISRITDSVKLSVFADSIRRAAIATRLAPLVETSPQLIGEPHSPPAGLPPHQPGDSFLSGLHVLGQPLMRHTPGDRPLR